MTPQRVYCFNLYMSVFEANTFDDGASRANTRRRRVREATILHCPCCVTVEFGSVQGLRACLFFQAKMSATMYFFFKKVVGGTSFRVALGCARDALVFRLVQARFRLAKFEWRGWPSPVLPQLSSVIPSSLASKKPSLDGLEPKHTLFASEFMRVLFPFPLPSQSTATTARCPRPNCRSGTQTQ